MTLGIVAIQSPCLSLFSSSFMGMSCYTQLYHFHTKIIIASILPPRSSLAALLPVLDRGFCLWNWPGHHALSLSPLSTLTNLLVFHVLLQLSAALGTAGRLPAS